MGDHLPGAPGQAMLPFRSLEAAYSACLGTTQWAERVMTARSKMRPGGKRTPPLPGEEKESGLDVLLFGIMSLQMEMSAAPREETKFS